MYFTLFPTYYRKKYVHINFLAVFLFRCFFNLVPTGVITIQRSALPNNLLPRWPDSTAGLCDLNLTANKKIEDIHAEIQKLKDDNQYAAMVVGGIGENLYKKTLYIKPLCRDCEWLRTQVSALLDTFYCIIIFTTFLYT